MRVAVGTPVGTLRKIPEMMRSCAVGADLNVVWAYLTDTNEYGHGFTAVVTGPADGVAFDGKRQEAVFRLYEQLADADVALPAGQNANPVPLVRKPPI